MFTLLQRNCHSRAEDEEGFKHEFISSFYKGAIIKGNDRWKTFCYHRRRVEDWKRFWAFKSQFVRFNECGTTIEIVPYHEKSKRRTWSSSTCCCLFLFHLSFIVLLFFCSLLITHLHARIPFYLNGVNSWWVHNS